MTDRTTIDDIDRGILHLLQLDARNSTPSQMAARLPVSEGTVRNRIAKMEAAGVIGGYVPVIEYERAGFPVHMVYSCTAPIPDRKRLATEAADIPGVVNVEELAAGRRNLRIYAIMETHREMTELAVALTELGLSVEAEALVNGSYGQPFSQFGTQIVEDAED